MVVSNTAISIFVPFSLLIDNCLDLPVVIPCFDKDIENRIIVFIHDYAIHLFFPCTAALLPAGNGAIMNQLRVWSSPLPQ